MTLRDLTRTVTDLVESVSGYPVLVSEDASLKTLAASRIARGANRIHSISFNPSAVKEPDYLICYQCGFILRLFGTPAADRVVLTGTAKGGKSCSGFSPLRPTRQETEIPSSISGLRDQLFDGLMTQPRSIPIGLRVDSCIMCEYPELAVL